MPQGSLTVLGLGAMGSAIAERLRRRGYATTVWNRIIDRLTINP